MSDFFINIYQAIKPQLAQHSLVFFGYVIVFFVAKPVLSFFNRGKDVSFQIRAMRIGVVIIFFLHLLDIVLLVVAAQNGVESDQQHFFIKLGYSITAVYAVLIAFNATSYYSRKKFGQEKKIDGDVIYLDTYNSRLFDIVAYVVILFVWMYTTIQIWDLDSLLQTTGFIGITLGFLALTNAIWLPDIYYGLVILNSNMLEDGDVIKFGHHANENIINRVTIIYTILLDVRNNHRLLVRNSQLINSRIDNLTKRASIDGLRHSLHFNIGYPKSFAGKQESDKAYADFRQRVQHMFESAFAAVCENEDCRINRNIPFEIAIVDSADYALTFALSFYLEAIPNTKITKTIRQYLVRTPAIIQEAVNKAALAENVQLATPMLIDYKESVQDAVHPVTDADNPTQD